jgi:predicted HicB family RNase H-like nuclease
MTLTLDLQPEIERSLMKRARAKGVSLAAYVQEVLAREAGVRRG